jgi:hypothetical protein
VCTWAAAKALALAKPPCATLLCFPPAPPDIRGHWVNIHIFYPRRARLVCMAGEGETAGWRTYIARWKYREEKKQKNKKTKVLSKRRRCKATHWHAYKASLGWLAHAYVIYINTNPCSSLFSSPFCVCVCALSSRLSLYRAFAFCFALSFSFTHTHTHTLELCQTLESHPIFYIQSPGRKVFLFC